MKKIFYNAFSYNDGGWFICEVRDYPYKHKTNKPTFVVINNVLTVSKEPEVKKFLEERKEVSKQLHDEMLKVATDLGLTLLNDDTFCNEDGQEIILEDNDGKKLTEALISLGWEKQFIPIGP
jgi:hypothetical protein